MWKLLAGLLLFFGVCLLMATPTEALLLKTSWAERVDLSEKIVRGQVVSVKSYWNPEKTLIHTDVLVLVDEFLKGGGPREITIKIPGGTVDDKTEWVSDTPQLRAGDYGIILLESSGQVAGGPDGVYLLKGEDGKRLLIWLRAYIGGDPKVSREGPPATPGLQR
jgi:hypothetical protein